MFSREVKEKSYIFSTEEEKTKLKLCNVRKLNKEFDKNQKQVFNKFKKYIDQDPENLTPVFKEAHTERKYFDDTAKVEKFWEDLWELEAVGRPNVEWLEEIRIHFENIVPEINKGNISFDSLVCFKAIQKKKNGQHQVLI